MTRRPAGALTWETTSRSTTREKWASPLETGLISQPTGNQALSLLLLPLGPLGGASNLGDCKAKCRNTAGCKGVEYGLHGHCEAQFFLGPGSLAIADQCVCVVRITSWSDSWVATFRPKRDRDFDTRSIVS